MALLIEGVRRIEKDRAVMWRYGLLEVDGFWDEALSWGDTISYPLTDGR